MIRNLRFRAFKPLQTTGNLLNLQSVCRYALDVHIDRAEDVLTHKRLLEEAKLNENKAAFHLRAVHVR